MQMLTSGLFWGTILILLGLTVLLKAVFGINLPIFRLLFGLIIIFIGIRVVTGGFPKFTNYEEGVFMGSSSIAYAEEKEDYSIIFGKGTIDLREIKNLDYPVNLEASVIFGNGKIIIPEDYPIKVELSSAMGKITLQDKSISGIGNTVWYSPEYDRNAKNSTLKASTVFGDAKVVKK